MPSFSRRNLLALAAATVGVFLAGCAHRESESVVKIPVASWPGYEYFYLASELRLDAGYGIRIDPVQYPDPQSIVHAYVRGDVDIAQLTTVEVIDICSRVPRRCPTIPLIVDESIGGDQILALKDYSSLSSLRGQPIAVTHSTLGPYVLSRALEGVGMKLSDVHLVNTPLDLMLDALRSGTVKAAALFPPYSQVVSRSGLTNPVFDSRSIPGEVFDVLAIESDYAKRNPKTIRALIDSWRAAHAEADANYGYTSHLAARREGITQEEFQASEKGLKYFSIADQVKMLRPGGSLEQNLKAVKSVQVALGLVRNDSPLPLVSNQFLSELK